MVMIAARLRTISVETGQRSRTACLTFPTHLLQNSLSTQGVPPAPATIEAKDAEVDQGGSVEDLKGGVVARE